MAQIVKEKTALVTGASTGIGYELAKLLAADGCNLVLVARREQRLRVVAAELESGYGIEVQVVAVDLAMATAADQVLAQLQDWGISLDILINNAGFGNFGPFAESDATKNLDMLLTNIVSLTRLTQKFLPSIIAKQGKILNVASLAAFQPVPLMAVYAATKAYVLSFSEALSSELAEKGVTVTALCPGVTETPFLERAGITGTSRIRRQRLLSAATVARIGYAAMLKGQAVVVPGNREKFLAALVNITPRRIVRRVIHKMQK